MSELRNFLELSYEELEELNLRAKKQRKERVPAEFIQEERLKYLTDTPGIKAVTVLFSDLEGLLIESACLRMVDHQDLHDQKGPLLMWRLYISPVGNLCGLFRLHHDRFVWRHLADAPAGEQLGSAQSPQVLLELPERRPGVVRVVEGVLPAQE